MFFAKYLFILFLFIPIGLSSQEKWPNANQFTYEERVKKSALNNKFDNDVLIFPNSYEKNDKSPILHLKNAGPIINSPVDINLYYWKAVTLTEIHKEYLNVRQQYLKNNELDKIIG